jgi:hypothetical protein
VASAGFVTIQGVQAGHSPWPHAGRLGPNPDVSWSPWPDWLADACKPEEHQDARRPAWNISYLVALEDRRAAYVLSLSDGTSSADIDIEGQRVGHVGRDGRLLQERLLEIAGRWVAMGRPTNADYTSTLTPMAADARVDENPPLSWVIDRLDYRQVVRLTPGRGSSTDG